MVKTLPTDFSGASAVLGIVLLTGSVIYTVHRSILYPLFYKFLVLVVYRENKINTVTLDCKRWERYKDPTSLQGNFKEWASQIHFLYCSFWELSGRRTTMGVIMPEGIGNADVSEIEITSEMIKAGVEVLATRWLDLVEISGEQLFGEVTAEILAAAHKSR